MGILGIKGGKHNHRMQNHKNYKVPSSLHEIQFSMWHGKTCPSHKVPWCCKWEAMVLSPHVRDLTQYIEYVCGIGYGAFPTTTWNSLYIYHVGIYGAIPTSNHKSPTWRRSQLVAFWNLLKSYYLCPLEQMFSSI